MANHSVRNACRPETNQTRDQRVTTPACNELQKSNLPSLSSDIYTAVSTMHYFKDSNNIYFRG